MELHPHCAETLHPLSLLLENKVICSLPLTPSLQWYTSAIAACLQEIEPGQSQHIRAVPSFASAPTVTAVEALQRENTRLKGLLSTTVQQTQAAIQSLEQQAATPRQSMVAATSGGQASSLYSRHTSQPSLAQSASFVEPADGQVSASCLQHRILAVSVCPCT